MVQTESWVIAYFSDHGPTLRYSLVPLLVLAFVLYTRHPSTNYIFDEQEALLANPYVNGMQGLKFFDAIHRDFWGLPPDGSIGSYRPIPDLVWRATWGLSKHPFFHHLYNILLHAINGALLGSFTYAVTKRRALSWLAAAVFVTAAVLTEAVSGIVGIADVLGGLGATLALCALRLPAWGMPAGVFAAVLLGMFSKESALVCVPLIPVAALLTAPTLHPHRPARFVRLVLAFIAALAAFVLYVELRTEWFPSPLPGKLSEPLPVEAGDVQELYRAFLVWFHQAPLPQDPLNNPLAKADVPHRVAGALRVYWRGLTQVVAPLRLSGDYSFPQEPIPPSLWGWETVAGGLMMVGPLLAALGLWIVGLVREHQDAKRLLPAGQLATAVAALFQRGTANRGVSDAPLVRLTPRPWRPKLLAAAAMVSMAGAAALATEIVLVSRGDPPWVRTWPYAVVLLVVGSGLLVEGWFSPKDPIGSSGPWPWRHAAPALVALGLVWMVVSYFPHSNIPVVLPTVRAERFWYFPAFGSSLVLAVVLAYLAERLRDRVVLGVPIAGFVVAVFLCFQSMQAYRHAMDYRDDLTFWRATKRAVPQSSKAHLNYSVMVGARGDLKTRLVESKIAMELAPEWPMAHIYTGDTLCRLKKPHEAWPHYAKGFNLGPNDRSLIALALQCLYDEGALQDYDEKLRAIGTKHTGSWIAYLAVDTLDNYETHKGVDPKYRPRGYNEGPKD